MKVLKWVCFFSLVLLSLSQEVNAITVYDPAVGNIVCHQKFAICDAAQCQLLSDNPKKVLCHCRVIIGYSTGKTDCGKRKPHINSQGQTIVISTFSLAQISTKPLMTCAGGNSWADCLNKRCLVDPNNPNQAFCSCDLRHTGAFQTRGGDCKTNTCSTTIWSGASAENIRAGSKTLVNYLGLTTSPENNCQTTILSP